MSTLEPYRIVLTEEEALARIMADVRALPPRLLSLGEALDAFAARDVHARVALPPFDNSSMDGYALMAASCRPGVRLRLVGEQPAGPDRKLRVGPGEAVRILTGAPIPAGADAVIMQEDTRVEGSEVVPTAEVEAGENIRGRGADVAEGQKIITRGDRLRPQTLAVLAAQGFGTVETGGQPRVAVISTGDELVQPGGNLAPGEIFDSNAILLSALAQRSGATVVSVKHCADRAEEIEAAVRAGVEADVLVISGGVSVGARDLVKPALIAVGARLDLWRVAVKPGKPFLYGRASKCAIFGLPGNPVSAFVTWLLFVRPAIMKLMGANDHAARFREVPARLSAALRNPGERPHYVRGIFVDGRFQPVGRQESHALFGLSRADALLRVRPNDELAADAEVTALLLD